MDAAIGDRLEARRNSVPLELLSLISGLADQPQLRWLSVATISAGLAGGSRRLARTGVRMLLAHELATAAKKLIKGRIDRTRPRSAGSLAEKKARPGRRMDKEHTSFPSGHSAGATAVASAIGREFPEARPAALAAAGLLAGSQVPRAAHYASDVVAGIVLGAAAEKLVALLWPTAAEPLEPGDRSQLEVAG